MTGLCLHCGLVVDASTGYTFPESIIIHATCLQFRRDEAQREMQQFYKEAQAFRAEHSCTWCGASSAPGEVDCEICHHQPHVDQHLCACKDCLEKYGVS